MPVNVPGPVPYAPTTLSPAPQMGMSIAQMMLQNAAQQGQQSQALWGQLGQNVAGIGQTILQGQREQRLAQDQAIERQIHLAALAETQNNLAATKAINSAINESMDEQGNIDWVKARGLVPKEYTVPALRQMADAEESTRKMEANRFQDQQQVSDFLADQSRQLTARMGKDPDGGMSAFGTLLWQIQRRTPFGQAPQFQEATRLYQDATEALQKAGNDPGARQAIIDTFRQHVGPTLDAYQAQASPTLRKQWADETRAEQELHKPVVVAPGSTAIDPSTGRPMYTAGPAPMTPYEIAKLAQEDRHNRVVETQKQYELTGGMGGIAGGPELPSVPAGGQAAATGDEFLKTLPAPIASQVKAYAEGRMPIPSGFALKSPYFQNMMRLVSQYDPTFDAAQYPQRVAARRDFIGGGRAAQTINALNTVVGHLSELATDAEKVGTSSIPAVNAVVNTLKTASGSPDVTNFMTRADGIANELMRVYRQTGAGSTKDIEEWRSHLNPNMSPEQKRGALATAAQMLEDKMAALENQKNQALGKAGEGISVVTPESRARLDALTGQKPSTPKISPSAPVKYQGRVVMFSQLPPDVQQKILAAQGQ